MKPYAINCKDPVTQNLALGNITGAGIFQSPAQRNELFEQNGDTFSVFINRNHIIGIHIRVALC